jgi:sulfate transport system permease protein
MRSKAALRTRRVLPGFGVTFALTWTFVLLLILIPLSFLFLKTTTQGFGVFWSTITSPRALASYRLSFGASAVAALVNGVFGLLVAWVLVRYRFPGRALIDALVDLPFALPTAVAGLTLTALYSPQGWLGKPLLLAGIKVAFAPLGVMVALTFIGLPFVVRTVEPVLRDLPADVEEVSAVLGASRWYTFRRVVLPAIFPAVLTGITLAFARAVGEYGSIVFISGNMPLKTEITPLLIFTKLEQYDYAGATALAVVMLTISFLLLFMVNLLQRWGRRRQGADAR